ncbi:MAG TPA: 50S ribosomal protein L11 methyltransferase [Pyrinomonadaceae bacterium]|nr:50S ribosomal protein L11 methyltransferase [Pyrinomonadaceae bacterium]
MSDLSVPNQPQVIARWHALDLIAACEAREAVEYALMEAGALGTETAETENDFLRVSAYFDHVPDRERVRAELAEALRIYELPSSSVREMTVRDVADQDWLGEWKKSWQPVEVGKRFIIAPPWAEISDDHNRIVIRIEPGMAFGTGTHETTRLCLVAIEKYFAGGSFLDVGTGTGILAIAAAKMFPNAHVEAYDIDADAIAIASENARLNGVAEKITFRVGTVEETTASVDLVCANLTADVIAAMLPSLISVTCGQLVLSGILDAQLEAFQARMLEGGMSEPCETMQDGEWIALIV